MFYWKKIISLKKEFSYAYTLYDAWQARVQNEAPLFSSFISITTPCPFYFSFLLYYYYYTFTPWFVLSGSAPASKIPTHFFIRSVSNFLSALHLICWAVSRIISTMPSPVLRREPMDWFLVMTSAEWTWLMPCEWRAVSSNPCLDGRPSFNKRMATSSGKKCI